MLRPCIGFTVHFMQGVIEGKEDLLFHDVIDVRDVARAHVLGAELPHAKGRYILTCDGILTPQTTADILSRHFPTCFFKAQKIVPEKRYGDNSKVGQPACLDSSAT